MAKLKLPEPHLIKHADVCRDGGSYSIGFETKSLRFFSVELPVMLGVNCTRVGYSEPSIVAYDKVSESIKLNWKQSGKLALELEACNSSEFVNSHRLNEALKLMKLCGEIEP